MKILELDFRIQKLGRTGTDFGVRNNRISGKHKNTFISGLFPTAKASTASLPFHNLLERDFLLSCEVDQNVVDLVANQEPVRWTCQGKSVQTVVPYIWHDRARRWHYVSVIKSRTVSRHQLRELIAPLSVAVQAERGADYSIVTEEDIRRPIVLTNAAHFIFSRMPGQDLSQEWLLLRQILRNNGPMTISQLQAVSGLGDNGFRTIVSLLGARSLQAVDAEAPLSGSFKVKLP